MTTAIGWRLGMFRV